MAHTRISSLQIVLSLQNLGTGMGCPADQQQSGHPLHSDLLPTMVELTHSTARLTGPDLQRSAVSENSTGLVSKEAYHQ